MRYNLIELQKPIKRSPMLNQKRTGKSMVIPMDLVVCVRTHCSFIFSFFAATTFGIALPKWLVSKEYGVWVLAAYGLVFMIVLPVGVVCVNISRVIIDCLFVGHLVV